MSYSSNSEPGSGFLGFLAVGLVCLVASGAYGVQAARYALDGQQTKARITDCYGYGKRGRGQTCHYDFQVSGKPYSGSVDSLAYSEGNAVIVNYLGANPENNSLDRPSWLPFGLILLIVGGVALGISGKLFMSNDDLMTD